MFGHGGGDSEGNQKRDWLSNWFKKRPPMETLRQKGIIKGQSIAPKVGS